MELQLNSIGDGSAVPAYRELLIAYLEANADRLRDEHRDRFRDNPLRVLDCKDDACRAVSAEAPKIVDHLCDPCAEHFAAVRAGLDRGGDRRSHWSPRWSGASTTTRAPRSSS